MKRMGRKERERRKGEGGRQEMRRVAAGRERGREERRDTREGQKG